MRKIDIFDTTLRDGAQTPFIGMDFWDRFVIAKALAQTGVDVIETGFAANDVEYEWMKKIAKHIGTRGYSTCNNIPIICSLSRPLEKDIKLAYESIEPADPDKRMIHIFIGTSEELMTDSHGKNEEEVLKLISSGVSYARKLVGPEGQVEYSSEDATRTDLSFLIETIQTAKESGANRINVPDTTGFAIPDLYFERIMEIKKRVKGIDDLILSTHNHHDSGNSVETTLKGILAGVSQMEGTVLQYGERAGNADWPTIVTDLIINNNYYNVDVSHIDTTMFNDLGRLISAITGKPIPLNHPVYGQAAFAESSGIHVKGVIKNYKTYFVIPPELVGRKAEIILGQTSGANTVAYFLRENGYGVLGEDYNEEQLNAMTSEVKQYCTQIKDTLTQTESELFANHYIKGEPNEKRIELIDFESTNSMHGYPRIYITLRTDGEEKMGKGEGEGPVDAFMEAIKNVTGINDCELRYWDEDAVYHGRGAHGFEILDRLQFSHEERELLGNNGDISKGQEANAKSMVKISHNGKEYHTRGFTKDVDVANYFAITDAFDAILRLNDYQPTNK